MSNSLRITMNEHNEAKEELRNKHYSTSKEIHSVKKNSLSLEKKYFVKPIQSMIY